MRTLLAMVLILWAPALLAAADPWPTTRIDVYKGDSGIISEDGEADLPSDAEVRKLESFLSYGAKRMEDWGFPAPALQLIHAESCGVCYRIYLDEIVLNGSDATGVTSSFGWSLSTEGYDVSTINRSKVLNTDNTVILPKGYIAGVHELFHTVQHRTRYLYDDHPLKKTNSASFWISEGTAEAVALYLYDTYPGRSQAEKKKGYIADVPGEKQYGGRYYSLPLPVEGRGGTSNPGGDYRSSSFWLYLGEIAANRINSGKISMPGPGREEANFSYLAEFFDQPNTGDSVASEITWLDRSLRGHSLFTQSLGETHARFLSTLAGYWNHRYADHFANKDTAQDQWLSMFFGQCVTVSFKPGVPSAKTVLDLRGLAGRCVRIRQVGGADTVAFDLQVETGSQAETDQLWLGEPNGQILSRRADRKWDASIERDRSIWFDKIVHGSEPAIFIITNAADVATSTKPVSATVQVTFNGRSKWAARQVEAAPARDPGPDGRAEALRKRVEAAGAETTVRGQYAMQMERDDSVMDIRLAAAPMALSALFTAGGSGGFMDQILTSGEGVGAAVAGINGAYGSGDRSLKTGEEITIRIPRIEYGFTGTVRGARIYTTGSGGRMLLAAGPQDSEAGPQRDFRPSGTLTITHFSPEYLAGSYKADFVDTNSLTPSQMQQSRPTLAIAYSAEETFVISAPWTQLDRSEAAMPANLWGEVESDLLKRMPPEMTEIGRAIVQEARSAGEQGRDPDFSGVTTRQQALSAPCDCSCGGLEALMRMGEAVDAAGRAPTEDERQLAACGMTCAVQYGVCEGD